MALTGKSANSKFDTVLEKFKIKYTSETRNKSGDDGEFNLRDRQLREILEFVEADVDEKQVKKKKEALDEKRKLEIEQDFNMAQPRRAATAFANPAFSAHATASIDDAKRCNGREETNHDNSFSAEEGEGEGGESDDETGSAGSSSST